MKRDFLYFGPGRAVCSSPKNEAVVIRRIVSKEGDEMIRGVWRKKDGGQWRAHTWLANGLYGFFGETDVDLIAPEKADL